MTDKPKPESGLIIDTKDDVTITGPRIIHGPISIKSGGNVTLSGLFVAPPPPAKDDPK